MGATDALSLRVSVAALVRVLFPAEGRTLLALERTATLHEAGGRPGVLVRAKPFGGGVRVVDPGALRSAMGDFHYDSERSRQERDFRLQIHPASWESVKHLCRDHLREGRVGILDPSPERELVEEFRDALEVTIDPSQYRMSPLRMVVENAPRPTDSSRAPGRPTVRIYYVFEAWLEASEIIASVLESSRRTSDRELRTRARQHAERGGRGRANAALAFGLEDLRSAYRALPKNRRGGPLRLGGHRFAGHVPVILDDVDLPRYESYDVR